MSCDALYPNCAGSGRLLNTISPVLVPVVSIVGSKVTEPEIHSSEGIMRYLHEHPDEGRALMQANRSWVFFREAFGDGPVGALGVPVRAGSSVAADRAFVPLGAPVWLRLDRPEADGLWIAQDTGGAIKSANRFDSFWGAGAGARDVAGGMSARGEALLFLPKGTLARLLAQ